MTGIFNNLAGKRYGRWTVIDRIPKDKKTNKMRGVKWSCLCDCGNKGELESWTLSSGWSKSCGCFKIDTVRKLETGLAAKHQVFTNIQGDARRRGIKVEISFEQFVNLSKKKCHYCGSEPKNHYKQRYSTGGFVYQGVDRVNNLEGYTVENIVPCCRICNRAKSNMTQSDFLEWVESVHQHQKGIK